MAFLFSEKHQKNANTYIFFDSPDNLTDFNGLDINLIKQYKAFKKAKSFKPTFKKHLTFTTDTQTIYVFGLEKNHSNPLDLEKLGGHIFQTLTKNDLTSINLFFNFKASDKDICHLAMGFQSKNYSFDKYKSDSKKTKSTLHLISSNAAKAKKCWPNYDAICQGMNLTRDIINEPANVLTTTEFVKIVKNLKKHPNIKIDILDEKALKKLGMNTLLAVGQGSPSPTYLAIIKYQGTSKSNFPLALVGKGITFDTGGNSLKPPANMIPMKGDLGGAATVIGLINTLILRKAKTNVVGVLAIAENMCSGSAIRPSDIITSYAGKTIEVLNTDAEGRLVLADALWYVQEKFSPNIVINLATLTGAIIVALGNLYAGLFSNHDGLATQLLDASQKTNDLVWRMPLHKEYDQLLNCDIADIKNIGPPMVAGSILAGQFLQRFIKEGTKWAHLDIAGTADTKTGNDVNPKAASGYGVRLLNQFIIDQCES